MTDLRIGLSLEFSLVDDLFTEKMFFLGTSFTESNMRWAYYTNTGSVRNRTGVLRSKLSARLQNAKAIHSHAT